MKSDYKYCTVNLQLLICFEDHEEQCELDVFDQHQTVSEIIYHTNITVKTIYILALHFLFKCDGSEFLVTLFCD